MGGLFNLQVQKYVNFESLLKLFENYLDNRVERVLFNSQSSEWKPGDQVLPKVQLLDCSFFEF